MYVAHVGDRHIVKRMPNGPPVNCSGLQSNPSITTQLPNPARGPGVRKETGFAPPTCVTRDLPYMANGGADMADPPLVLAYASPLLSMVRESSATVASAAMRIPFMRSSRV